MTAAPSSRPGLPRGFSVYQAAPGARLQFFPALGSAELDGLLHAHLPGPAPARDKRASVSLDFLGHARATGQSFKFYPAVADDCAAAAARSPPPRSAASSSSSLGGGGAASSPVAAAWDWGPAASASSRRSSPSRAGPPPRADLTWPACRA